MTKITKEFFNTKIIENFFTKKRWAILTIALLGFIIYSRTFGFGFLPLDDWNIIVHRIAWYKHLTNMPTLFVQGVFSGQNGAASYYRPTLMLSFMIDSMTGGGDPVIFHVTNVLLHIIASVLCFLFLLKFIANKQTAFLFSLFFVVHPVFVHAVAWIPGRNDTLLAIFVLPCVLFFINFIQSRKWYHFVLHLLFFFLSLITKENAIVLFPILILYYWLFSEKRSLRVGLTYSFIWVLLMTGWFILKNFILRAKIDFAVFDLHKILLDASQGFFIFVGKMILPINQSVLPTVHGTTIYIGIIVIAVLTVMAIRYKISDRPRLILGIAWFLLFLIVPLSLATFDGIGLHYEHRLYVPMIGFILFLSCLQIKIPHQSVWIVAVLCLFAGRTFVRTGVYQDSFTFAQTAVEESPDLPMSYNLRGLEYERKHDLTRANADFLYAIKIDSMYAMSLMNLGVINTEMGDPAKAIMYFNRGLKIDKYDAAGFYTRGNAYFHLNDMSHAIADYSESIRFYPEYSEAYNNRGNAYAFLKQYDKAFPDYDKAIQKEPRNALAYCNRAIAYQQAGDYKNALSDIENAIAIRPSADFITVKKQIMVMQNGKQNEGSADISNLEQQLLPQAIAHFNNREYQQAIEVFKQLETDAQKNNRKRNKLSYMNNIGMCYLRMGRMHEADQQFTQIIILDPNYDKAYANLGLLNKKIGNYKMAIAFYKSALLTNPANTSYEMEIAKLEGMR